MMNIEKMMNVQYDRDKIISMRQEIIDNGKHQYTTEEHRLRSARTITVDDAIFLYKITSCVNPKVVIEIGTWFGTSATIIANATNCIVHTCDRNNVYCGKNERIKFYNIQSDLFLKKMIKKDIRAEMCFIDANLRKGDAEKLRKIMPIGVFVVHDHVSGEKGERAVAYLRKAYKDMLLMVCGEVAILDNRVE